MILECKHQEQLCSRTIYSSRLAQITKKWLLSTRGGQSCCWFCPGPPKAAVIAYTGKPAWNITPDIFTGDQLKASNLPPLSCKENHFFFKPTFLKLFLSRTKDSQKNDFFLSESGILLREQDIYSHLKKPTLYLSLPSAEVFSNTFFKAMKTNFAASLTILSFWKECFIRKFSSASTAQEGPSWSILPNLSHKLPALSFPAHLPPALPFAAVALSLPSEQTRHQHFKMLKTHLSFPLNLLEILPDSCS